MPKPTPSFEDTVIESWWADAEAVADQVSAQLGTPPESAKVGDAKAVALWGQRDPKVDRETLLPALQQGLPPEVLETLAVARAAPDLAPLYLQPVQDPELAEMLAVFAEFPLRHQALAGIEDPVELVKEAERLDRLWQRTQSGSAAAPDESAPPEMPLMMGGVEPPAMGGP